MSSQMDIQSNMQNVSQDEIGEGNIKQINKFSNHENNRFSDKKITQSSPSHKFTRSIDQLISPPLKFDQRTPLNANHPTALSVFKKQKQLENTILTTDLSQNMQQYTLQLSRSQQNMLEQMSPNQQQQFSLLMNQQNTSVLQTNRSRSSYQEGFQFLGQSSINAMGGAIDQPSFGRNAAKPLQNESSIRSTDQVGLQTQQSSAFNLVSDSTIRSKSFLQQFGKETAKFKVKNESNSGSPVRYYIGDEGSQTKQTSMQIFDSTTNGFPYMKKKFLHKASDIQQMVDEPEDDSPDLREPRTNDKSTFTEMEFLDLKKFGKTQLFTVLEDTVVYQRDKIKDLKEKLKTAVESKNECQSNFTKALKANESLHSQLQAIKEQVLEINKENFIDQSYSIGKETETVLIQCIKFQLDCLSFYKDVVSLNRELDGKKLKSKLDKYIQNEGHKLNVSLFKKDYFEQKLAEVQTLNESVERKRFEKLLQADEKKVILLFQSQEKEYELLSIYNSQSIKQMENKYSDQEQICKLETDNKMLKKKIKQLDKSLTFLKQNGDKSNQALLKEYEGVKQLFTKLQIQNADLKQLAKGLKIKTTSSTGVSISDHTSLLMKKLKQSYVKNSDEIKSLAKDVKANLDGMIKSKGDHSQISKYLQRFSEIKGKFTIITDYFKEELGYKYFSAISESKSTLVYIEQKLNEVCNLQENRYASTQNKHLKSESDKQEQLNKISQLQDELQILRGAVNDSSIKKIFEQISIILLQGCSDQYTNVFNEQQRQLLRTLFGNQVQNVMQSFGSKLQMLERQNKDLIVNRNLVYNDQKLILEQSLALINDILDILTPLAQDNKAFCQPYIQQKQTFLQHLKHIESKLQGIENEHILSGEVAINEIDRRLSMIDESSIMEDQSTDFLNQQMSLRRSGSQGAKKVSRYRERIQMLQGQLEIMQLENLTLKKELKNQAQVFNYEKRLSTKQEGEKQKLKRIKLKKSKSDPKYIAFINLSQQFSQLQKIQNDGEKQIVRNQLHPKLNLEQQETIEPRFFDSNLTPINNIQTLIKKYNSRNYEAIEKQYEDQNQMLQSLIHSQALYIEETLLTTKSSSQGKKLNQSSKSIAASCSISLQSSSSILKSNMKKNSDTESHKSKSVTRYQDQNAEKNY